MAITLDRQVALINDEAYLAKIGQAALRFALQVQGEPETMANHTARVAMANMVLVNLDMVRRSFAMAVATRLNADAPTDGDIDGNVRAVWNQLASAMFPGSE